MKRKRDNNINWVKIIFLYILFGFLIYKGALFLFTSDYFSLKNVEIDGLKTLSEKYIIDIAGLKGGENLFLIDIKGIKERLKNEPWIKSVIIKKKFPDTLFFVIQERIPYCILTNIKESVIIDSECTVLTKDIRPFSFLKKIVYNQLDLSKISLGEVINDRCLCDAIYIIKVFNDNFPGFLKRVNIKKGTYIKIYTKTGLVIIIGTIKDFTDREKFAMLKKILKTKSKYLKVLDLRYKKGIIGK